MQKSGKICKKFPNFRVKKRKNELRKKSQKALFMRKNKTRRV